MDKLNELLKSLLGMIYPQIVFDTQGLASILLPCLLICLVGLIISLLMKPATGSRRFSHVPVLLALIAMIAASAFFPVTLINAGNFAMDQLREQRQRFAVEETEPPEDAEAVETEAPLP